MIWDDDTFDMSADFWAGYISGAVGIVIGNPLDILKVRLQAGTSTAANSSILISGQPSSSPTPVPGPVSLLRKFSTGTAAPILGYGALNALLFVSYNRTEALLNQALPSASRPSSLSETTSTTGSNLWTTFLAGAIGGLATWVVSTPTELIKCRAQLATNPAETSSWAIAKHIWRTEGRLPGFFFGGTVTALRDSVGYGFYFWSYELTSRWMERWLQTNGYAGEVDAGDVKGTETAKVLLCGGIAGVVTWASIFPLDVVKTRMQAQVYATAPSSVSVTERTPLVNRPDAGASKRLGAIEVARQAYRDGGFGVFFRGLTVCSVRAFVVNAVQWATYEWIMMELGQGRKNRQAVGA